MTEAEERVRDLLGTLNEYGEDERIEAKRASSIGPSLLETICAFANEPGLDGGALLLGVARNETGDLFGSIKYEVVGVPNPEKLTEDLASQCASVFNHPVRPRIETVPIDGRIVIHVRVAEASPGEKPIYLKKYGLPGGAFRRIGATDQQCTDDDVQALFDARRRSSFDGDLLPEAKFEDLDPDAIEEYRQIRGEIAPEAEEIRYSDKDLLQALHAVQEVSGELRPTVAGVLLFGTSLALRRLFPMMRVDYIRVPGKEWVPDPANRYTSVTIRASLIRAVRRAEAAILDDLPKAFNLPEGSLQRRDIPPLPRAVLREAIVNAVMHRDYRVHGAVQIIRYANRMEIINPGYSLKSPERLGEPGSQARNPHIAAVFHDTNLAETKGTGIRSMRRLMKEAELLPPAFESNRSDNQFSALFLMHHFLGDEDLAWLTRLGEPTLSADEKLVLVFIKETGAIDNGTYRNLTGAETLKASTSLRHLCDLGFLLKKGQSTATYYIPTERFLATLGNGGEPSMAGNEPSMPGGEPSMVGSESSMVGGKPSMAEGKPTMAGEKPTMVGGKPAMGGEKHAMPDGKPAKPGALNRKALFRALPRELRQRIDTLGGRSDGLAMRETISALCLWRPHTAEELATLLGRNSDYLKTHYLKPMVTEGLLRLTIPDMPKHPNQAYRAVEGSV